MANCRVQNLAPACAYNGQGVLAVMLLDIEDFNGFVFEDAAAYQSCYVNEIVRSGEYVTIEFNDFPAQYTGALSGGVYTHSLEAFIAELSGDMLANLHLATKRPQLVVFKAWDGRYFVYGQDTGAKVSYTGQTADNTGAAVTIVQNSPYPLYEVNPASLTDNGGRPHPATYDVLWDVSAVCQVNGATDELTGFLQATLAVRVSVITGEPLDADNVPTSQSGRPQSALKLTGTTDPAGYEVVGTFPSGGTVNGEPTLTYDPVRCLEGGQAPWVLDTGFWDMSAYWLDDGVWNY